MAGSSCLQGPSSRGNAKAVEVSCVNGDLVYCFACFACFDIWLDLANPVAPQFLIEHLSNLSQNQSISSDSILSLHHTTTFHLWRRVPWRFSLMVKLLVCGTHSRTVTIEMLGKMSQISRNPSFSWEMSDSGFKFQNHPRSCIYWGS